MKKATYVFILVLFISSCNQNKQEKEEATAATSIPRVKKEKDLINEEVANNALKETHQSKADSLIRYYKLATSGQAKQKYERLFFETFPATFLEMEQMFGYDDTNGAGPLYESPELINYFGNLTSIPKAEYYRKYTGICINGVWQADNMTDGFGFADKLLLDTEAASTSLENRTDKEIKSIFRFIFDGPHRDNKENKELYQKLLPKLTAQSKRLGKLLTDSYEALLNESEDH